MWEYLLMFTLLWIINFIKKNNIRSYSLLYRDTFAWTQMSYYLMFGSDHKYVSQFCSKIHSNFGYHKLLYRGHGQNLSFWNVWIILFRFSTLFRPMCTVHWCMLLCNKCADWAIQNRKLDLCLQKICLWWPLSLSMGSKYLEEMMFDNAHFVSPKL